MTIVIYNFPDIKGYSPLNYFLHLPSCHIKPERFSSAEHKKECETIECHIQNHETFLKIYSFVFSEELTGFKQHESE